MMWWYIWSLVYAHDRAHKGFLIVPLFVFSLLLGIRLSYLSAQVGILMVMGIKWRSGTLKVKEIPLFLVIGILFPAPLGYCHLDFRRGYSSFLRLAFSFTNGHFQEWGGAIGASDLGLFERGSKLLFENTMWTGGVARSVPLLVLWYQLCSWRGRLVSIVI